MAEQKKQPSEDKKTAKGKTVAKAALSRIRAKRTPTSDTQKLHLLCVVVNRNKADFYADLLQTFEINLQLFALADGTASPDLLHLLQLTESKKAVLFSFVRDDRLKTVLAFLAEKFETVRDGKGIAYTVPLDSMIGVAAYQFLSNNRMVKEKK